MEAMTNNFGMRRTKSGDEIEICNLVARSFNEFIAPEFSEEGIEEFFKYSNPRDFIKRAESGYFSMVAVNNSSIAGMIEIKQNNHLSMLYVDKDYHRRGIAKCLIREALKNVKPQIEISTDITVNSSRYAVPFYEKLGFLQFDEEKAIYGVIHIPMMVTYSKLRKQL